MHSNGCTSGASRRAIRRMNLAAALALGCLASGAAAAESAAINDSTPDSYPVIPLASDQAGDSVAPARSGFTIAPYLWAPSIKGPVGAGTTRQSIDLSGSDLIDGAESGLMGYLRWTFGRQFVYFEGIDASWEDESFESFFRQDVDSSITFLEAGYGHEFRLESTVLPRGHLWLSPYVGVRYASLDVMIGLVDPIQTFLQNPAAALLALQQRVPMEVNEEIVDAALGLFVDLPLSKRLSFLLKLDGAGFDLDQSRYWNAAGTFGYDFSQRWSILAGYRIARIEAEAGSGNELNLDWRLSGPIGSVSFTF